MVMRRFLHVPILGPKAVKRKRLYPKFRHQDASATRLYGGYGPAGAVGVEDGDEGMPLERRTSADLLPELSPNEKEFFMLVNTGDVTAVSDFIKSCANFNLNCQNYQGKVNLDLT